MIIGGGICGLATAISLTKAGFEVVLFERNDCFREVGAGLTLWSNGMYALRHMALHEPVLESGQVVQHFEFLNSKGRSLGVVDLKKSESALGVSHLSIHRMRLMQALERQLESKESVRLNHEFVSFTQERSLVHAHFANGHVESGDLLLDCEGFHSRARKSILNDDKNNKKYAGYTCWRGVTRVPSHYTARGDIKHYVGPGAQVGIFDVGFETVCWYATANVSAGRKDTGEERKRDVLERFADYPVEVTSIFESTESDDYLKNDIYDRDPVSRWIDDRVLLMGDAAHPTTPNLGQGACLAIEDAATITDCLQKHKDHRYAFARYSRLRKKRTAQVVIDSRRVGEIGQQENPLVLPVRDFVFEALVKSGQMRSFDQSVCYKV
jgi:2-polyprenyl-6-methoxyphenol hydroxylase-like FAD-dependent oxidoreductase